MSSPNVSYLRYCGSFLFLGVTGAVRDVLAKVEIVEVSESLADVTGTTLCNVREGGATSSVATTILILAIKTDVCGSFLHVTGIYACKDAPTYIFTSLLSRGGNGQSMLYDVLEAVVQRVSAN